MAVGAAIDEPVLVEATRGDLIESRHRGVVAAVDVAGNVLLEIGDIGAPVYPRSAIKPLQALPLIETGAADAFGLGDEELALACASHGGTARHVSIVEAWLARIGLGEADLRCGAHRPYDANAPRALYASGGRPTPLHNNCSGKHAGMLNTAMHCGDAPAGYMAADHPVQRRVLDALQDMCELDLDQSPVGVDGCGIPTIAMPLRSMALGMARFAAPVSLLATRAAAVERIRAAMAKQPALVAWQGTFVTDVLTTTAGNVIVKNGAEGVFCAALPALGLGVAIKIADGASRAAEVATMAALTRLGAFSHKQAAALTKRLTVPLRNWTGTLVGELRPGDALH